MTTPDFLKIKTNRKGLLTGLDALMVIFDLAGYVIYMSGDYFVPSKSPVWLGIAGGLFGSALMARLYLTFKPTLRATGALLVKNWTLVILVLALLAGMVLRYQASRNPLPLDNRDTALLNQASGAIFQSNWKPGTFMQPPFYFYVAAGLTELKFLQQVGTAPGKPVAPADVAGLLRLVNLALGGLAIWLVYLVSGRWWNSRRTAAIAATLLGTSWLAYQATPALLPQTLGAVLALGAFYFISGKNSAFAAFWAGVLAGLATAACYGGILLLVPVALVYFKRWRWLAIALLGWLLAFTMTVSGWLFSLNDFVTGLAAIGGAPADAAKFYLSKALQNDAGLVIILAVALVTALVKTSNRLWLALAFPLLYAIAVCLTGPEQIERLALIAPFAALAGAYPLEMAAQKIQARLDARDDRHPWGGNAFAVAMAVLVALVSVVVRRFS